MKCNNKHCKYYEPAKQANEIELMIFGRFYGKESGCKYPYCKLNGRRQRGKQ